MGRVMSGGGSCVMVGGLGSGGVSFGSGPPSAAPVQVKTGTNSAAFQFPVTAGNAVIVVYSSEGTITSSTISDTLGTTYTEVASVSGHSRNMNVYVGVPTVAGANTVTASSPANNFDQFAVMEVANCSSIVDLTATAYNGSSPSSTSITTTNAADFIFAAVSGFHNTNTFVFGSPFVLSAQANGSDSIAVGYTTVSATGTYTLAVTTTTNSADNQPTILIGLKYSPARGMDGQVYFDTSTNPYSGYVYRSSAWHAFS